MERPGKEGMWEGDVGSWDRGSSRGKAGDWIKALASCEDPSVGQDHRAGRRAWGQARAEEVEGVQVLGLEPLVQGR